MATRNNFNFLIHSMINTADIKLCYRELKRIFYNLRDYSIAALVQKDGYLQKQVSPSRINFHLIKQSRSTFDNTFRTRKI